MNLKTFLKYSDSSSDSFIRTDWDLPNQISLLLPRFVMTRLISVVNDYLRLKNLFVTTDLLSPSLL